MSLVRCFDLNLLWYACHSHFKNHVSRNPTASNKRARVASDPSDNEPILPLHHRITDVASKIWYYAKPKYKLVVERIVGDLLESQVSVLAHFRAIGWNTMATMARHSTPI